MKTTMSAGVNVSSRIPKRSCRRTATVTAILETANSMPADDMKYRNTISVVMMKAASANRVLSE